MEMPNFQKRITALIMLPLLLTGMVWVLVGIFRSEDELPSDTSHISSGWEAADSAVDDALPWYESALRLRTTLTLGIGSRKVGNVYISEERLLREPESLDSEALSNTVMHINAFYTRYSVPTCMTLFPEAAEIYTESLPEHVTVPSQRSEIKELYSLVDSKIRTIDAYHILSTFKDDYIYYRTDSGCTAYGAYCVYRNLIRKMGYYPISYDSCFISHVKNDFCGDLYRDCLYDKVVPDILDVYSYENSCTVISMESFDGSVTEKRSLCDETRLESSPQYFYAGEPALLTDIKTDSPSEKNLLVIKDSRGDAMLPFLVQHYTNISVIDITCLDRPITELLAPESFNQVLFICDGDTMENTKAFAYLDITESEKND